MKTLTVLLLPLLSIVPRANGADVYVEAERFDEPGGWKLDTQFIHTMGSPYLLAHGLGEPVADAVTTVELPRAGAYDVYARTRDWVAPWNAPGAPGKFRVALNGKELETVFGTEGAAWHWQPGGSVELPAGKLELSLRDLTGFGGRCDAVLLRPAGGPPPPDAGEAFAAFREKALDLSHAPPEQGPFDLVVVGGGYGGTAAAIAAARMGCTVALVQNRPVLGGNGSSEIRVWAKGGVRRGLFPAIGEIVEEFADSAKASPAPFEQWGDDRKEVIIRAETNITLFLNHHAYGVEMAASNQIRSVFAFDTRSGQRKRFSGRLFADCTGHAFVGQWAGADHTLQRRGHLGMSNMWMWENADEPQAFPEVPWALDLKMADFPYPVRNHGQWFWESGFEKHPIDDLEQIRDWNHRAVYGAFNAMKNGDGAADHPNARLTWLAYIGGPRESVQLLGDVVLTRDDIVEKREFPDGCVATTWTIDLHYPNEKYSGAYRDNPFIAKAVHDRSVDRVHGYPVPYRCFYSRNIDNLFMAGRNVSVTHEALGTVRVMKTGGMMGEVVGKAASIAVAHSTTPRGVYELYLDELKQLLQLPGESRRPTVNDPIQIGESKLPQDSRSIPLSFIDGIVVDNKQAKLTGDWVSSTHNAGYIGEDYMHDDRNGKGEKSARFEIPVAKGGLYKVSFAYRGGTGRPNNVPVTVEHALGKTDLVVDETENGEGKFGFRPLGEFLFQPGKPAALTVSNKGTEGPVVADAVRAVPVE